MLALVYLVIIFLLGDAIGRRFFSYISIPHRLASAFLIGLLASTWFTYFFALIFSRTGQPLIWANLVFFIAAAGSVFLLRGGSRIAQPGDGSFQRIYKRIEAATAEEKDVLENGDTPTSESKQPEISISPIVFDAERRPTGNAVWDWVIFAICMVFGCWLMFAVLDYGDGSIKFAVKAWSDFGANISLAQSMALGNNFPTQHPFFPGETIRYHFLFWFQSANLSFLGLNIVRSVNLLSILSFAAMISLIMTLGEVLFNSRIVGRISAILFFFGSTSLTYIPFVLSKGGIGAALNAIIGSKIFLDSGYPFHGETWGGLTVNVFAYQRHLIAGVAMLLMVVVYLIDLYRRKEQIELLPPATASSNSDTETVDSAGDVEPMESDDDDILELEPDRSEFEAAHINESQFETASVEREQAEEIPTPVLVLEKPTPSFADLRGDIVALILCGVMVGALPYWNSAVFVASAVVIGSILIFLPIRRCLIILIAAAVIVGLPQLWMLQTGHFGQTTSTLFKWGYIVANPTIKLVLEYIGWTFGLKLVLIPVALWFVPNSHRRIFLAFSSLFVVVFLLRLSVDPFNNHKLLNVWNILIAPYIAYVLWLIGRNGIHRFILAFIIGLLLVFSSVIDLFPLHNDAFVSVPYQNDKLTTWILDNTNPHDVFLSDTVLSHPIVFAGRKVYLGNTLFAWGAGYNMTERESNYRKLFSERDPEVLIQLLNRFGIAYVAIDDNIRHNTLRPNPNDKVYEQNFEKVFEDTENHYGHLTIYKVPSLEEGAQNIDISDAKKVIPVENLFSGGFGKELAQFAGPRGIAVGSDRDIYIADTQNARIRKFKDDGTLVSDIGKSGNSEGDLIEPNGIAIDAQGNIYVADAGTHRLIRFNSDGTFEKQWKGPEPGFFGPRAVAIASNGQVFILDQGRSRVVRFDPKDEQWIEWGTKGGGEGEFHEATGIDVGGQRVYVADGLNNRIQIFDLNGVFLAQWPIAEWNAYPWQFPDVAFDGIAKRIYVTDPRQKNIIVFDQEGNRQEILGPPATGAFDNPSALAVGESGGKRVLYVVDTGSSRISKIELLPDENTQTQKTANINKEEK